MEKFSQYRDKATGVAPFLPVPSTRTWAWTPLGILLSILRFPVLFSVALCYFLVLQWLPIGSLLRKAILWMMLLVSGVWWIDLQVEGVKKGNLSKQASRIPSGGHLIVSSFTSPLDALYLAAIFDPIFTASYPSTTKVQPISLISAISRALYYPSTNPPSSGLVSISELIALYPDRIIALFPESTTTNGRGVLRFSPCLTTVPSTTPIFPVSLRYTPGDITTPLPATLHLVIAWVWRLLSQPTHCIRVRIADKLFNQPEPSSTSFPPMDIGGSSSSDTITEATMRNGGFKEQPSSRYPRGSPSGKKVTQHGDDGEDFLPGPGWIGDAVAESLAKAGRVKRVNLGVKEKTGFVKAWGRLRS